MRTALVAVAILTVPLLTLFGQTQKPLRGAAPMPPAASDLDQVSIPREAVRCALGYLGVPYMHGGTCMGGSTARAWYTGFSRTPRDCRFPVEWRRFSMPERQ